MSVENEWGSQAQLVLHDVRRLPEFKESKIEIVALNPNLPHIKFEEVQPNGEVHSYEISDKGYLYDGRETKNVYVNAKINFLRRPVDRLFPGKWAKWDMAI